MRFKITWLMPLLIVSILSFATTVKANDKGTDYSIHLKQLNIFESNLLLLSQRLGTAPLLISSPTVSNVSARELFIIARLLFRNIDRLTFEWTKTKINKPYQEYIHNINSDHVLVYINAASHRLNSLMKNAELQKTTIVNPTKLKSAEETYVAIYRLNKKINHMLIEKTQPLEVFHKIKVIHNIVDTLLKEHGAYISSKPLSYEHNKTPFNVFHSLTKNLRLIKDIYDEKEICMMNHQFHFNKSHTINPSDVYDLASIVLAELHFLQHDDELEHEPFNVANKKHIIPSDVYHLSNLLSVKLNALLQHIKSHDLEDLHEAH